MFALSYKQSKPPNYQKGKATGLQQVKILKNLSVQPLRSFMRDKAQ